MCARVRVCARMCLGREGPIDLGRTATANKNRWPLHVVAPLVVFMFVLDAAQATCRAKATSLASPPARPMRALGTCYGANEINRITRSVSPCSYRPQAACRVNVALQTLYMQPEIRHAVLSLQTGERPGGGAVLCQLQRVGSMCRATQHTHVQSNARTPTHHSSASSSAFATLSFQVR